MMKQRLELDWVGKDQEYILEPRILLNDQSKNCGDKDSPNLLINGDNLLALKALEGEFSNKIKCIYIDPPYNSGNAFEHYDDGIEHSKWLSLMKPRLEILWRLLSEQGSLWISIDKDESHYLKVLCDECFGRDKFLEEIIWQKRTSRENRAAIGSAHETILLYVKGGRNEWKKWRNKLPSNEVGLSNPDNDPRGPWKSVPFTAQGYRPNQMYEIKTSAGNVVTPPKGRCWGATESEYKKLLAQNRVYFPKDGTGKPRIKQFPEDQEGLVPMSLWLANEVGSTEESKKEILDLFPDQEPFGTPKPERLIERIIHISTNPGDYVLDSFLGSGTTAAVAHKMNRKWIGIELGEHCETYCRARLDKVIQGADQGGISKTYNWTGGGGFKFMNLAPSLLEKDDRGNWIISKKYNPTMLANAVCKHEGFKFHPDQKVYWKQGYSTEKDFIFVTTQFLTAEQFQRIYDQMKSDETLLVCAKAFKVPADKFDRITIKKIPQSLLNRGVEFGRDDYSFSIKQAIQEEMDMEIDPET